jgi:hypothetical protein
MDKFPLQAGPELASFMDVRRLLAICLLLGPLAAVQAQDQESQLVNRLLRPDMSLQSAEQNKKFVADKVGVNKKANVSTFYIQQKSNSKTFSGTRDFSTRQLDSPTYQTSRAGDVVPRADAKVQTPAYSTSTARTSTESRDSHKKVDSSTFAGNRSFVEKGKSQKALDRKNPPMTIEQVRELLNKN